MQSAEHDAGDSVLSEKLVEMGGFEGAGLALVVDDDIANSDIQHIGNLGPPCASLGYSEPLPLGHDMATQGFFSAIRRFDRIG